MASNSANDDNLVEMTDVAQPILEIERTCPDDLKPLFIWLKKYLIASASTDGQEIQNKVISVTLNVVRTYDKCGDYAQNMLINHLNIIWPVLTKIVNGPDVTSSERIITTLNISNDNLLKLKDIVIPTAKEDCKFITNSDSNLKRNKTLKRNAQLIFFRRKVGRTST